MTEQDGAEVKWTYDYSTDTYYRIDDWGISGAGDVVPKAVEEVPEERVPPHCRKNTIGLGRGVLDE